MCDRWAKDRSPALQYAHFNGVGYESWENVWGMFMRFTQRDGEALSTLALMLLMRGVSTLTLMLIMQGATPLADHVAMAGEALHHGAWCMVHGMAGEALHHLSHTSSVMLTLLGGSSSLRVLHRGSHSPLP